MLNIIQKIDLEKNIKICYCYSCLKNYYYEPKINYITYCLN